MRARVATFNIHHGLGTDGRLDLDRTSAVIRRIDPQLIALQELDRGMVRSGRVDQPAAIEDATGLTVRFRPTVNRPTGGEYGIALASSEPLDDDFIALPQSGDEEPRGAIVALWHGVLVVATHLSTIPAARTGQIRALASGIEDRDGPVLLLGDLNDRGSSSHGRVGGGFGGPVGPSRSTTSRAGAGSGSRPPARSPPPPRITLPSMRTLSFLYTRVLFVVSVSL
jgi:endonuclease/exonuclease/phosphatase family metal-dependent hydrolase